jgi:Druantia protein DruA
MEPLLSFRGRDITPQDASFIRDLIARHPDASRYALSKKLCEAWDWRQENGELRHMVCRSLMLALHRAGHIELPPARYTPRNPMTHRQRPVLGPVDQRPVQMSLKALGPLALRQVRRTDDEGVFNGLVETFHYLGYTQPVGAHLKYLVWAQALERPVACLALSSAPRHLGPRDRYIGWSSEARKRNIRFVVYNSRYLILPWVRVEHLASHLLGWVAREVSGEWERVYGHPVYFLETFVDPARFRGTCYRAANWVYLGQTTGRGKDDHTNRPNRPLKDVLGYPLTKRFRELLGRQ